MISRQTGVFALSLALGACSTSTDDGAASEFSGVWLYEFEGSTFIEGATEIPRERPLYSNSAWLDYHPDRLRPDQYIEMSDKDRYDVKSGCYPIHAYLVRFEGHRVTDAHGSGHGGLWPSEVKVDRMISSDSLGRPFCYGN